MTLEIHASDGETGQDIEAPSRVEDVDGEQLVIAAPRFPGDLRWAYPGREVLLSWASERGVCMQRFHLVAVERQNVRVWRLAPATAITVQQRRRYVRAAVTGPAELELVADQRPPRELSVRRETSGGELSVEQSAGAAAPQQQEEPALKDTSAGADAEQEAGELPEAYSGQLVDISEGGARLAFAAAGGALSGRRARLRTVVDGVRIDQQAAVLRTRPLPGGAPGAVEVQLHFVEPVEQADHLRRYVLRVQIEHRRKGER
ncbi:PilZ domain-containing protein [Kineococcus sp. NUM-3379]